MEKIMFTPEGEEPVAFYVLEQTQIGGFTYILVADQEEGDAEALILKDISVPDAEESLYIIVEDEIEQQAVASVFENMLEDTEISGEE